MLYVILGYAVFVNVISLLVRRARSGDEYLMGGREFSPLYVAFGLFTLIGGGELVTMTSLGYTNGFAGIALFLGYAVSFIFLGFVAPRLRANYGEALPLSLPDFIHAKYGRFAGHMVFTVSFLAFFGLLVMQFTAAGNLLGPLIHFSYKEAVLIASAIAFTYLFLGGLRTVMTTDLFQGVAMLVLLPLLLWAVFGNSGSTATSLFVPKAEALPWGMWISMTIAGILGGIASADVWQRAYAAKDSPQAKKGFVIGAVLLLLFGFLLTLLGVMAKLSGKVTSGDTAFSEVMTNLLPGWATYLAALLIIIVILSTADTEMFLLSGMAEREILRVRNRLEGGSLAAHETKKSSRLWLAGITAAATVVGLFFGDLVTLYSWLLSAGLIIAPIVAASLLMKLSKAFVNACLICNAAAFVALAALGIINLDNAYLVSLPSLLLCACLLIWRYMNPEIPAAPPSPPTFVPPTEVEHKDSIGAASTNLFGAFCGFFAFAFYCLYKAFSSTEPPFPFINGLKAFSQPTNHDYEKWAQIIIAVAFLIHHWRVFAGFAFTHNEQVFKPFMDSLDTPIKKVMFRGIKTLFVVTFPFLVLLSRSDFVWAFKIIWFIQALAAVVFVVFFWNEMLKIEGGKAIRKAVIFADIGFLVLSFVICFLTSSIQNPLVLFFILGIVCAICGFTVLYELPTYLASFQKTLAQTKRYVTAKS